MDGVLSVAISVQTLEKWPLPKFKVSSGKIVLMCDKRKEKKQCIKNELYLRRGSEYATPSLQLWHKDSFVLKAIEKQQTLKELCAIPYLPKRSFPLPFPYQEKEK